MAVDPIAESKRSGVRSKRMSRVPAAFDIHFMIIRVLGCSGAIAAGSKTTSFLLDDDVLIDAGTGVGDLTLDELVRIDHILLSHSHLDHVLSVGLLADSVMRRRAQQGRGPIIVHALPATIEALRQHIFNGVIWPDFTRLPSTEHPVLQFATFAIGQVLATRWSSHRGAERGAHGAGGRLSQSKARKATGSSPATPGRTRTCGCACAGCGSRTRDRDGVQRRRAHGRAHQPSLVPIDAGQ